MEKTFHEKLQEGLNLSEELGLYGFKLAREFPQVAPKGFKNLNRSGVARGYLVAGSQLCGQIIKAVSSGSLALGIVGFRSLFEHSINCAYIFDHPIHKRKMRRINKISLEIFSITNNSKAKKNFIDGKTLKK